MNNYARVCDMRPDLNAFGVTSEDSRIVRAIAEASAFARGVIGGRQFHTTFETRYFDGRKTLATSGPVIGRYIGGFYGDFGRHHLATSTRWDMKRLYLNGADLLSITTIKVDEDGDGIFEVTLTAGTDYYLWPYNAAGAGLPYRAVDLAPNGQMFAWPVGQYAVQIVGKWGHSEILQAVVSSGVAVTGTVGTTTGLVITASVAVDDLVFMGDTLYIEDEQCEVTDVSALSITVTRGINGTTAATHTTKALSIRRFPDDLERAVRADAARFLWRTSQGMPEGSFREAWPAISDTFANYLDPAGVF